MNKIKYLLFSAAVLACAACSSEIEEPAPKDFSGKKVMPEITVAEQGSEQITKKGETGSTYFKAGEHIGFLLLDENNPSSLYNDTKDIGVLRYTYDGVYWSTYDSYGMTESNCKVYCFYPYPESEDHSYEGTWPNSYRKIETGSNTDYLWGISKMQNGQTGINGMTPQVHMQMQHALTRISFRLKRTMVYDPNSTIGKGDVTAFTAYGYDASNRPVHGSSKYCFITGKVNTPVTPDNKPVAFNQIAGNSIPQAVGSFLGSRDEYMSAVPFTGTIRVSLTIDGQSYTLTIPSHQYVAGNHYQITLEYKGSQVVFKPGTGATGGSMEIIPWTSGGSIGVKGNN